jgi:hypothetical protein
MITGLTDENCRFLRMYMVALLIIYFMHSVNFICINFMHDIQLSNT